MPASSQRLPDDPDARLRAALRRACPQCQAEPGQWCTTSVPEIPAWDLHLPRWTDARASAS